MPTTSLLYFSFNQALEEDNSQPKPEQTFTDTPFKMISTAVNDSYVEKIDAYNYEKSLGSQFKHAWNSLYSLFGNDQQDPRDQSSLPKGDSRLREEDLRFPVETFEKLLYADSKNHGVTIKTMTKVKQNNADQRADRKR